MRRVFNGPGITALIAVILLGTLAGSSALAQEEAGLRAYLGRFPEADANRDGVLSQHEFLVHAWTMERKAKLAAYSDRMKITEDVEYARVGDQSLKLDLYLPKDTAGARPPLVVWIHGGGWAAGTKHRCVVMWLATEGYAVASVQYRLASNAHPFPLQVQDCKGAIRWLRRHGEEHGYDAERIVVSGESAGGHLAALIGTSGGIEALEGDVGGNLDVSSRVQGVINFYGPTDLEHWAGENLGVYNILRPWVGGESFDESRAALRLNSPLTHVTGDDPPLLTLQGDADTLVPVKQVEVLHLAYRSAGIESRLEIIEGAGHTGPQFEDEARKELIRAFVAARLR